MRRHNIGFRFADMARCTRPHRHEFFGRCRVDRHRCVEIRLRPSHFYDNAEKLRHFASLLPEEMDAKHFIGFAIDEDFHEGLFVPPGQGRFQRPEARRVDVDAIIGRTRLHFREADSADFRCRKHSRRNILMVDTHRLLAKYRVRKSMAFSNGDRRQRDSVGDVSDRIDGIDVRFREPIHLDRTNLVKRNAGFFQTEPSRMRRRNPRIIWFCFLA